MVQFRTYYFFGAADKNNEHSHRERPEFFVGRERINRWFYPVGLFGILTLLNAQEDLEGEGRNDQHNNAYGS